MKSNRISDYYDIFNNYATIW